MKTLVCKTVHMAYNGAYNTEPLPLAQTLERLVSQLGGPSVEVLSSLSEIWPGVVGGSLAAVTTPGRLEDGVLTIICDESDSLTQLQWMESQVLDALHRTLGNEAVTALKPKLKRS